MNKLRLGISTCPNDTFTFAGLLEGEVETEGLEIDIELHDIRELNSLLRRRKLDAGKASFHAALHLRDDYGILGAGSAIGKGVGPLLLAGSANTELSKDARVLCPGEWTTATLLLNILYPQLSQIEYCVFSEIMPRLESGEADFGVVIHEGRFTYQLHGLRKIADLGSLWEKNYFPLLPLGGILAARSMSPEQRQLLNRVIRSSLQFGYENRDCALRHMRCYAAEFNDDVLWEHVHLYVNDFTFDIGDEGCKALHKLGEASGLGRPEIFREQLN